MLSHIHGFYPTSRQTQINLSAIGSVYLLGLKYPHFLTIYMQLIQLKILEIICFLGKVHNETMGKKEIIQTFQLSRPKK